MKRRTERIVPSSCWEQLRTGKVWQRLSLALLVAVMTMTVQTAWAASGDLTVTNTVYPSDNNTEFTFTVTLSDESINGTYGDMSFTAGEATFTLTGGHSATATDLPTDLTYTVAQTANDEFSTTKTGDTGTISTTQSEAAFTNIMFVTQDNFYNFFDANGFLLDAITFDELIFKGEFSNSNNELVPFITIDRALTITGDEAVLNNIGVKIDSSDQVTLDHLTFIADKNLGSLINVESFDVSLTNLNITYNGGDEEAVAINVEGDDVNILNNTIIFESHVPDDTKFAIGLKLTDCSNVLVDGNSITTKLPCVYVCNYDEDYYMMGSDKVNAVRLKDCTNLVFTNNIINSTTNEYSADFPTIQAIQIIGCDDLVLDHNNISLIDEITPAGLDNYLYGINFGYNENVTFSNNNFKMSTEGGRDEHGTAYAIQNVESDVNIIGNSITSVSKGPNLGIYVASLPNNSDLIIEDNFIQVTGCASSAGNWALVSGIEIQNGDAKIHNNTIYTSNVNDYDENAYMYGISYAQWMYGDRSFDIQDNTVYTEGKYAISVIDATSLNVVKNTLCAHELGDDSVNPGECENVNIKENLPEDGLSWSVSAGTLSITGKGAMAAAASTSDYPWYNYCSKITSISIGEGVTSIANNAFGSVSDENTYSKVAKVTIPSTVTSIGADAFKGCVSATDVYCFADPANLKWRDMGDDFKSDGSTKCHVAITSAWSEFSNVHVTFEEDLGGFSIIQYIDANGNRAYCTDFSVLKTDELPAGYNGWDELPGGWYVVENWNKDGENEGADFYREGNVAFEGDAHLILCDGTTTSITCEGDIPLNCKGNLTIYGQSGGTGALTLNSNYTTISVESGHSLTICGGSVNATSSSDDVIITDGDIILKGGTLTACADDGTSNAINCSGALNLSGGKVEATKGAIYASDGATIASGQTYTDGSTAYTTSISSDDLLALGAVTLKLAGIVITSANFAQYFDYNGDFEYNNATPNTSTTGGYFLKDGVPVGSTLDFQGEFIPDATGNYNPRIFINKRVNITSSDKSAVFKPYKEDNNERYWWDFGILEGADYTVVENLKFENCWVFNHGSSYVTFDGIDMKVEGVRIGSGVGALSIRTIQSGGHASDHTTVMNSVFYCKDNGGNSCISAACGAPYVTFHNNTITLEGNVGNGINVNTFNSDGNAPAPEYGTFTNNVITNEGPAKTICWCIIPCGQGNLIENNTVNYEGYAINTVFGKSVSEEQKKNIYRNNTTTLGGSISVYEYSVVENNQVSGQLSVAKGATATGNTVAGMTVSQDATVKSNTVNGSTTISGTNVTFQGNTVNGSTTISGTNVTFQGNTVNGNTTISKTTASFTDNAINGTLTLNSASGGVNDNNTITGNVILSTGQHAIELKSSDNTVSGNILISADHEGDAAVKTTRTNTIADNTLAAYESATASSHSNTPYIITSETTAIKAGDNAGTFYYVPTDATVTINDGLTITPNEGATSPKVNLMLGNGSQLNVGNISGSNCSLTLYGQSMDGMLTATGTISAKNINLNGATVTANGYSGTVTIASGKTYYDGTGARYTGTLTSYAVTDIVEKTLRPYDYRTVEYVAADGTMATATARPLRTDELPEACSGWDELPGGWYVVENSNTEDWVNNGVDFYFNDFVIFQGDAHLILCDGAEMSVSMEQPGTSVQSLGTLTIYGQSGGSGRLSATNTNTDTGGNGLSAASGLTINGGIISASSSNTDDAAIYCWGDVVINGGTVIANGTIDSDNNSVTIAEGMIDCTTGTKRVIANGITDDVSNALKGQTVDISYSRTYTTGSGSGKASTLCLPFDFEAKADDGIYATFSEVTETAGVYEVKMTEVDAGTMLTAGTPYMFLPKTSDKLTQGNAAFTVPVEGFAGASSATNGSWQFKGTFEKKTWESGQTNLYGFAGKEYYLSNGSQIASDDIGSFRRFDYGTCAAFRCYLLAPESSGARGVSKAGSLPETLKVRLVKADGTTTAIGTLDTRTGEVEFGDDWYDLNGRRLDAQPTQKGVYIHNGNKTVIK